MQTGVSSGYRGGMGRLVKPVGRSCVGISKQAGECRGSWLLAAPEGMGTGSDNYDTSSLEGGLASEETGVVV